MDQGSESLLISVETGSDAMGNVSGACGCGFRISGISVRWLKMSVILKELIEKKRVDITVASTYSQQSQK